jgi:predicted nucleotidyltransferase
MKHTPYRIRKRLEELVTPEEVNVTDVSKLKSGLSGKIWLKDGILKPELKEKMIILGKEFYSTLKLPYPIKDILFTGSLANYNWTSHSDVDIHVLFDAGGENDEFLTEYIQAKKDNWLETHDISLYGFPVELFAKGVDEVQHKGKAIYSLLKNDWIKKPSKKNVKIDSDAIRKKAANLMNQIDDISTISNDEIRFKKAEKLKNKIKKMRAAGLENGGEFATENLVFKTLRNNGYAEKLGDIKTSAFDKQMSLNENKNRPVEYGVLMLNFNIPNWKEIIGKIHPDDLYNEPGFGLEEEPHVTALYGFHDEVTAEDVKEAAKKYSRKPISVKLTGISLFQSKNRPFDVVKFDVHSAELGRLNKRLQKLPNTNEFPEYHPHMTIAYVKKGAGAKYVKEFENPLLVTGDVFVFSDVDKNKEKWSLIKKNILKIQKGIPGMTEEKINILKDFVNFTCSKLKIEEPVTVVIRKERDEYIQTTASYLPHENENHIRAGGRALVDICRSIGHELTHNRQRELGIFKAGEEVQNIGGKIEDEANSIAGILIKDFSHNYGYDRIYELD